MRRVLVTCWCEEGYVYITQQEVNAGLTAPCKNPDCIETNRAERRREKAPASRS